MTNLLAAFKKFRADRCTDLAAGLTYYSMLAIFPAALALLALLGVVGEADASLNAVLDVLRPLVSANTLADIEPPLRDLVGSDAASWTLLAGALAALWSASAYVGAFSRAMNTVHGVEETRPLWKLRPLMLLITLVSIVLCAAALLIVVLTGPIADSMGNRLGIGDTALTVWSIAKWPVLALLVVVIVSMLLRTTPNTRRTRFSLLTVGAFVAIVIWLLGSVGFAFYVANFSSYNKTYGSVGGVIVLLVWLWLTNLALLIGAEIDAQIQRGRQEIADAATGDEPYPGLRTHTGTASVLSGPDASPGNPTEASSRTPSAAWGEAAAEDAVAEDGASEGPGDSK